MGILDAFFAQDAKGEQLRGGLLGMGLGLMNGADNVGGRFAPAMAQGFAEMARGTQDAQQNQMRQQQMLQQQQMTALKAHQLQRELAQQEQFGKFFSGDQPSGGAQAFPAGSAANVMSSRIQQAINSGNPDLMDWGFKAQAAQKEKSRRTQFDPATGLLIDLDTGAASPIMGPGGALQPKDDLVWDSARGGFVNKKNMEFNPAIDKNTGLPVPAQNILEKPLNDTQSKDLLFGSRALESDKLINDLTPKVSLVGAATNEWRPPGWVPFGGAVSAGLNKLSEPETQQFNQAKRDFVNAVLRKESGAVISEEEFANAELQYFPQPGDTATVIQQKAANRDLAARGIMASVPQGRRESLTPQQPAAAQQPSAMASPRTAQDFQSLPSGTLFQAPDGSIRRKP